MSLDLSLLRDSGISWLDASGPESGIVLSTRVRLARNLQALPFTIRTSESDREAILQRVLEAGLRRAIAGRGWGITRRSAGGQHCGEQQGERNPHARRSSRFFRCTSKSDSAAGVTPEMRPA